MRRISQRLFGLGYTAISLGSWIFELLPAALLTALVGLAYLSIAISMTYPIIEFFVLLGFPATGSPGVARDLSGLATNAERPAALLVAMMAVFYRRLMLPRSMLTFWLGLACFVPFPFLLAHMQKAGAAVLDGSSASAPESKWDMLASGVMLIYLLMIIPITLGWTWTALGHLSGRVRFPRTTPGWLKHYFAALPRSVIRALRESPALRAAIALSLSLGIVPLLLVQIQLFPPPWFDVWALRSLFERHISPEGAVFLAMGVSMAVLAAPLSSGCFAVEYLALNSAGPTGRHALCFWISLPVVMHIGWWIDKLPATKTTDIAAGTSMVWAGIATVVLVTPYLAIVGRAIARVLTLSHIYAISAAHNEQALLLRPFALDKTEVGRLRGLTERAILGSRARIRLEEVIAALEFRRRSVAALGSPQEQFPELGAMRDYCTAETWRPYVIEALRQAERVIFILDDTPHTRWEAEQIMKLDSLDRVIFVVANAEAAERFFGANPEVSERLSLRAVDATSFSRTLCIYCSEGVTTLVDGAARRAFDYELAYNYAAAALDTLSKAQRRRPVMAQ